MGDGESIKNGTQACPEPCPERSRRAAEGQAWPGLPRLTVARLSAVETAPTSAKHALSEAEGSPFGD
jgi:hypothetical protein